MTNNPIASSPVDIGSALKSTSSENVRAIGQLAGIPTIDKSFGHALSVNPSAALAAKGIHISDADAARITQQIQQVGKGQQSAKIEVGVTVGIG